jgi:hypothetical protein
VPLGDLGQRQTAGSVRKDAGPIDVQRAATDLSSFELGPTHSRTVSHKHLDYYLDEFTFRFNRRKSMNRGKLFYRLVQQAVAIEPVPLDKILHPEKKQARKLPPRKTPATLRPASNQAMASIP